MLNQTEINQLQEQYPDINVKSEAEKMLAWGARKDQNFTVSLRFAVNWLNRSKPNYTKDFIKSKADKSEDTEARVKAYAFDHTDAFGNKVYKTIMLQKCSKSDCSNAGTISHSTFHSPTMKWFCLNHFR